ncbi:hypothetical protein BHM03_00044403 [Ensete ventricosum]|nr:hypothetical protein BHM03_00044403 [Ensete ventricosum]
MHELGRYGTMVCTIPANAWTWLVRSRKAFAVTMNDAGFDAGEGNPGSVIILQKRLRVGTTTVASSVGRGWSGYGQCFVPESANGRSGDMGPPSSAKNVREEFGACPVEWALLVQALVREFAHSRLGTGSVLG